jgi:hypothetical protein
MLQLVNDLLLLVPDTSRSGAGRRIFPGPKNSQFPSGTFLTWKQTGVHKVTEKTLSIAYSVHRVLLCSMLF